MQKGQGNKDKKSAWSEKIWHIAKGLNTPIWGGKGGRVVGGLMHSWAPMAKKTDWIDTDKRWTVKKHQLDRWSLEKKNLSLRIETIGQK
jgi:hypothetical protein